MTRTLSTFVQILIQATATNTLGTKEAIANVGREFVNQTLTTGVEADEADRVFYMPPTDLLSGNEVILDVFDFEGLDGGAGDGKDPVGLSVGMLEVVTFLIYKTGDGTLTVDPDPAFAGWTPGGTNVMGPGEHFFVKYHGGETGLEVLDGTSHRLRLAASGDDVRWQGIVLGRTRTEDTSSSSSSSSSTSSQSSVSTLSTTSSFSASISVPGFSAGGP